MKTRFGLGKVWYVIIICVSLFFCVNAQAKTLKIGAIAPLSGAGAPWGQALVQGVQLAIDEVNDKGGLKIGKDQYKLALIDYDDKYTGAAGVQAANRLISVDKVKIIFGSISSAAVLAFTPVTQRNKVLVLGNCYSSKAVHPGNTYYFRVIQTSMESGRLLIPYVLKKHPGIKKVALLGPNDESGKDLSETDAKIYKSEGLNIVYNEFYERAQKDFSPQLTKMLSLKPDLIDTSASSPGTTGLICKQARMMGYKGEFLTSSGFFVSSVVKVAGDAANGFYYAIQADLDSSNPKMVRFMAEYKEKYGKKCDMWSCPLFYASAQMLFGIMEREGTTDPTDLKKALENMGEFENISGTMHFGGKEVYGIDHQILGPLIICTVENGKEKVLEKVE